MPIPPGVASGSVPRRAPATGGPYEASTDGQLTGLPAIGARGGPADAFVSAQSLSEGTIPLASMYSMTTAAASCGVIFSAEMTSSGLGGAS